MFRKDFCSKSLGVQGLYIDNYRGFKLISYNNLNTKRINFYFLPNNVRYFSSTAPA